jgi:integrase
MFKLRLLTAQRGAEIESMRWADIELPIGWWTIPSDVSKNKRTHRVPLSTTARELLIELKSETSGGEWVFPSPTRAGRHIVNVQKAARGVRKDSGVEFVPHDLRRTAASIMAGIGTPRLVVGKILNHAEPGVTRVYDRHSYDKEKRNALDKWAVKLNEILADGRDNVVSFAGRKSSLNG